MENGWTETGNGEKRATERNGEQTDRNGEWGEMENNGEKQVAGNGNGRTGWCCGVVGMYGERDRLVQNVVKGLGPNRGVQKWCQSHRSGLSIILCDKLINFRHEIECSSCTMIKKC